MDAAPDRHAPIAVARTARMIGVVLAVLVGIASARAASVAVFAAGSPEIALRLDTGDAKALTANADRQMVRSGGRIDAMELAISAKRALQSEPLSAAALRQLGMAAQHRGDQTLALRLMNLAESVSRRDLGTHVWMIESRVAAGDIAGALNYYDLALTVSKEAPALLHPILGPALDDPAIRQEFAPYLNKNRPWMLGMLNYAVSESKHPEGLSDMILRRGGLPRDARYRPLVTQLVGKLVASGQFDAARRYVQTLPEGRAAIIDDAVISDRTTNPLIAPLTWQLIDGSEVRGLRDGDGFSFTAGPNARGVALDRIFMLTPGRYQLMQSISPLAQIDPAQVSWELRCLPGTAPDAAPAWREEFAVRSAPARYRSQVAIGSGCRAQRLSMIVAGRDGQSDSGVRVGNLSLRATGPVAR